MPLATPEYRILIRGFKASYDYSPGPVLLEIVNWYNIGWADYVNDVPEAFFTVLQRENDKLHDILRTYEGRAHVEIRRAEDVVFAGWMMESDSTSKDGIIYCYGYLAGLYWQATDYATVYTSKTIAQIVSAEWLKARDRQLSWTGSGGAHYVSMLRWITTGTIEAPPTTSGGAVALILPDYKVHHKRVLFMLRELAAIGMSDTTNKVLFQITPEIVAPTFNFFKNRSTQRPGVVLEYGDDQVADFRVMHAAVNKRNKLHMIGSNPNNVLLRQDVTGTADIPAWGLREEAMYLSWVRDQTSLLAAGLRRLSRARRVDNDVSLSLYPNSLAPPWNASSGYRLNDTVRVKIDRGLVFIDAYLYIVGTQTVVGRGGVERVRLNLQELVGV